MINLDQFRFYNRVSAGTLVAAFKCVMISILGWSFRWADCDSPLSFFFFRLSMNVISKQWSHNFTLGKA